MKTLLSGLAGAIALAAPWAAHAQYGYDPYPPQDDGYVCQAQGCVSADPPYYDPGYGEQPYDYGHGQRDARCDYGCAHYHWEETGQSYEGGYGPSYGEERFGYGQDGYGYEDRYGPADPGYGYGYDPGPGYDGERG